jgi:hypothetical protein
LTPSSRASVGSATVAIALSMTATTVPSETARMAK